MKQSLLSLIFFIFTITQGLAQTPKYTEEDFAKFIKTMEQFDLINERIELIENSCYENLGRSRFITDQISLQYSRILDSLSDFKHMLGNDDYNLYLTTKAKSQLVAGTLMRIYTCEEQLESIYETYLKYVDVRPGMFDTILSFDPKRTTLVELLGYPKRFDVTIEDLEIHCTNPPSFIKRAPKTPFSLSFQSSCHGGDIEVQVMFVKDTSTHIQNLIESGYVKKELITNNATKRIIYHASDYDSILIDNYDYTVRYIRHFFYDQQTPVYIVYSHIVIENDSHSDFDRFSNFYSASFHIKEH